MVEVPPARLLFTGTPSITNNGWLLPLIEENPRKITLLEPPGAPVVDEISTPATLPCKPPIILTGEARLISSDATLVAE
ncbi:hypothetical protein D3C72_503750 [compost metagenome]